ncbi:hypothetical protein OPT61_g3294 [Boeremia exigua]|uniref:Uncharacterized protein n=1 Tax=Boeremia exigua TaxID=749465 RepID=A0ACC2IIN1_9PLEO|nr:hypothetical protein OPT61_g3294 [Boeremia exigua]
MIRDTQSTYFEVHGSKDKLLREMSNITASAIVDGPNPFWMLLRFIDPNPRQIEQISGKVRETYEILPPTKMSGLHQLLMPLCEDHDYLAVSYCWNPKDAYSSPLDVPEYQVQEPGFPARNIRCPAAVFHRAVRYAREIGCRHVWIDQECINQNDNTDVQYHLNIMHQLYTSSMATLAVLSKPLSVSESLHLLTEANDQNTRAFHDTAIKISQDDLFTRTWILQEVMCGNEVSLSIPLDASLQSATREDDSLIIPFRDFIHQWHDGHLNMGLSWATVPAPIFQPLWLGITQNERHESGEEAAIMSTLFRQMENCENHIVADRVSIFANIFDLSKRVATTALSPECSLITALLVQLLVVIWSPEGLQTKLSSPDDPFWDDVLEQTIFDICDRERQLSAMRPVHENIE